MNNIILEKHTLPVLKSEKLLKRNKLLTIQNINKDFELENSKEYKKYYFKLTWRLCKNSI